MDLVALSQVASAVGTLILASLTLVNVLLTRNTVREMQKARVQQSRPQVIVDVDFEDQFRIDVVVRNIGSGAAKDVTFEFSHPLIRRGDQGNRPSLSDLDHFKKGIEYLAPGAEIRTAWGTFPNLKEILREHNLEDGITVTSMYKNLDTADFTEYKTNWNINLLRHEGSPTWVRRGQQEIAEALMSIAKDFHSAMALNRGFRIVTETEQRRYMRELEGRFRKEEDED